MISAHTEKSLADVEQCFNDVAAALVSGEPVAVEATSALLRQAAINLSTLMHGLSPAERENKELTARLKKIADGTATLKGGLFRRTALVEMALNAVVPATQDGSYAKASGPYGSAGKQTGAFKYLAA